jgi:hypothetical protein
MTLLEDHGPDEALRVIELDENGTHPDGHPVSRIFVADAVVEFRPDTANLPYRQRHYSVTELR